MFGGMGVYTGEKMFAFLIGEDIGFKLSPDDIQEALKLPGSGPDEARRGYGTDARVREDAAATCWTTWTSFMLWLDKSANYAKQKTSRAA